MSYPEQKALFEDLCLKVKLFYVGNLRRGDFKYQELMFKTQITDFFIFCQEKPFGELFLKMKLKLARGLLISRNPTKSRIAVFALLPENLCIFTSLSAKDDSV